MSVYGDMSRECGECGAPESIHTANACEYCGAEGCHWQNHAEARAEVRAEAWKSWDDDERQEISGWAL